MNNWRIISEDETAFQNRREAAQLLCRQLEEYKIKKPVVLGIPRGGLVIASEIARFLDTELDIALAHKLGAPGNPELAIGAVVEGGKIFLDEDILRHVGADEKFIRREVKDQLEVIHERAREYRAIHPKVKLKNRIVIVTDDGAARGLTMQAALWGIRHENPEKLICALPVAPSDAVKKLARYADEVICLRSPAHFMALGQFFQDFNQVTEEQVKEILKESVVRKK